MTDGKACKLCNFTRQKSFGVFAPSLEDLKKKGCESLGLSPSDPCTVVLENDGTIIEDQAYFLCLPSNTKFMLLHGKETWAPARRIDGGTAWVERDSVLLNVDVVDMASNAAPWVDLAHQLKQNLTNIILMSEADLQTLVDAPSTELASVIGFQVRKAEDLQQTLQRVLDRKEEERQSKELLQLYLKSIEKEESQQEHSAEENMDLPDGVEVDSVSGFTSRTLMVLKGKTSPESRLSTEDLQMVVTRGVETMQQVLGWDEPRTSALLQACKVELSKRLQQIQAMQSISNTQQDGSGQSSRTNS